MNLSKTLIIVVATTMLWGCTQEPMEEKGFQVGPSVEEDGASTPTGLVGDSLGFATRPSSVLLTGVPHIRLTTVYKVNVRKQDSTTFIGGNDFHYNYEDESSPTNNWNGHLMPGIEAVHGYNLVNVSHYDVNTGHQKSLFERPVLIKTLYYPSFSNDTLNGVPIAREHLMVTLFNEDTNKDGYINARDLRRMHLFDLNGQRLKDPVAANYSVFRSEYDPANDRMHVFAKLDANNNGKVEDGEAVHIHWIDLKDPTRSGRLY